jgi:hypothetical protein
MTALQFGPFVIPFFYLVIVISAVFCYVILFFMLKDNRERYSTVSNLFTNSLFITVLTWKISPSLLNPESVIEDPFIIFYQVGTQTHLLIGIMLSIVYMILSSRKLGIPIRYIIDLFPFLYVGFLLMYNLLTPKPGLYQIPFNYALAIIYLFMLYRLWKLRSEMGTLSLTYKFCIKIGLIYLILSFFEKQNIVFGGISSNQFYLIVLVAVGLLKPKVINGSKEVAYQSGSEEFRR